MTPVEQLDHALARMGEAMRRADDAFTEADAGFAEAWEAWEALKALTLAKGSLTDNMTALRESIAKLQRLILELGEEIRHLKNEGR